MSPRPTSLSARGFILVLLVALALPGIGFATYLLSSYSNSEQQRFRGEAARISTLIGRVMDGELRSLLAELHGLSSSAKLRTGAFEGFYEEAQHLVAGRPIVIVVRDLAQRQVLNTQVPFGQALPPAVAMRDEERAALLAGHSVIGSVYKSPISGEPRVAVAMPVTVQGETYAIAATIPTAYLRDVLVGVTPSGWTVTVADRAGVVVTRSERHQEFSGKPGLPDYLSKMTGDSGTFRAVGFDGVELLAGYQRSPLSNWVSAANIRVSAMEAPSWNTLRWFLFVGGVAVLLSTAIALFFAQRFTAAARQLVEQVRMLGAGDRLARRSTGIREFDRVAEALSIEGERRHQAEQQLRARTEELEVVLDTAPVAVWFSFDPEVRVVQRNRQAAELMRVPIDDTSSVASRSTSMSHLRVLQDGQECRPEQLPLQRALAGLPTDNAEYTLSFGRGDERIVLTSARPLRDSGEKIRGAVSVSIDITDRQRAEEQRRLLTNELDHRVKNALTTFQSLATQTLRGATSVEAAEEALRMRLHALAAAHDKLTSRNWVGAELQELVTAVLLRPHQAFAQRLTVSGPSVWLTPDLTLSFTLALHELMTNAMKYGALSNDRGRVDLSWTMIGEVATSRLSVLWTETNGPAVRRPERTGFGTRLLQRLFQRNDGVATIDYLETGVICRIEIDLNQSPKQ